MKSPTVQATGKAWQERKYSLDLGVSKESDGSFISLFPKVPGGKTKRIVVPDGRIQVAGQSLKVGLRRLQLCGDSGRSAGSSECGSGCGGRKKDGGGGLHGGILFIYLVEC